MEKGLHTGFPVYQVTLIMRSLLVGAVQFSLYHCIIAYQTVTLLQGLGLLSAWFLLAVLLVEGTLTLWPHLVLYGQLTALLV